MSRLNPIEDLAEFAPKSPGTGKSNDMPPEAIERIAKEENFPSRQPVVTTSPATRRQQRRYVTGRNQQINIKATSETISRLHRLADDLRIPLGALLERALVALEKEQKR